MPYINHSIKRQGARPQNTDVRVFSKVESRVPVYKGSSTFNAAKKRPVGAAGPGREMRAAGAYAPNQPGLGGSHRNAQSQVYSGTSRYTHEQSNGYGLSRSIPRRCAVSSASLVFTSTWGRYAKVDHISRLLSSLSLRYSSLRCCISL